MAHPAEAPYESYVAGAGLIEAASRNVEIATPVSGVVQELYIRVGEQVEAGQALFRIEGADAAAEVRVKETAVAASEAKVKEAEATLEDYRQQLRNVERIGDPRAVSAEEIAKRRANVAIYSAKVSQAKADLENVNAQLDLARVAVARRVVRAPLAGEVLQVNLRKGEFAAAAANSTPLLLLGETDRFAVRVDIDENDAWRFRKGEPARAFIRGNSDLFADLRFAYVEPYVKPKTSLTGRAPSGSTRACCRWSTRSTATACRPTSASRSMSSSRRRRSSTARPSGDDGVPETLAHGRGKPARWLHCRAELPDP